MREGGVEGIGDLVPVRIDDWGRTTTNHWTDKRGGGLMSVEELEPKTPQFDVCE
jgi:hypothetical protein